MEIIEKKDSPRKEKTPRKQSKKNNQENTSPQKNEEINEKKKNVNDRKYKEIEENIEKKIKSSPRRKSYVRELNSIEDDIINNFRKIETHLPERVKQSSKVSDTAVLKKSPRKAKKQSVENIIESPRTGRESLHKLKGSPRKPKTAQPTKQFSCKTGHDYWPTS